MERERIQDVIENISRRLHNGLHNKKKNTEHLFYIAKYGIL